MASAGLSISLPRPECKGDRCAISHVGFSGGVVCLSPYPAAISGLREDSSDFAPGSVAGPCVAQTVVVRLSCGAVSGAGSTPPTQTIPPPTGMLQGNFSHPSSKTFKLHAWMFFRVWRTALPASWLSHFGLQQVFSTKESGTYSVLGVQRDR